MIPRSPSVGEGVLSPNEPVATAGQVYAEIAQRTLDLMLKRMFGGEHETEIPGYFTNEEPEASDEDAGDAA